MKSFEESIAPIIQGAKDQGFMAGQQSKQAEVDELRKHKEILLGELFLVSDAIQYRRVLNLLKGDRL